MRALNLLQYPSLSRQQKRRHQSWTSLAGLALGAGLAWAALHGLGVQTLRMQAEQQVLQARWVVQTQQAKAAQHRQLQAHQHFAHWQQWQRIQQHQRAWVDWHESLQDEAQASGLRLERMQAEALKIELQGTTHRAQALPESRQSLSESLEQPLQLVSMTSGVQGTTSFVWQAPWSAAPGGVTHAPAPAAVARP